MSSLLYKYLTRKQASLGTDVGGAFLSSQIPYVGPFVGLGGTLHGFTSDDTDVPGDSKGLIPGVGGSRLIRRHRRVRKELVPESRFQRSRIISDQIAPLTPAVLLGLAGAGVGSAVSGGRGARIGAGIGAGIGVAGGLLGALLAGITRRRTAEEQLAAEKQPAALAHVVPGLGTYNLWKRLGYSRNYDVKGGPTKQQIQDAIKLLKESGTGVSEDAPTPGN
jgi:hypothetical protein